MSHPEQLAFFELLAGTNDSVVRGAGILEVGSYDVNGSIRKVFGAAGRYVGVDLSQARVSTSSPSATSWSTPTEATTSPSPASASSTTRTGARPSRTWCG